jgi:hypothetical protein
MNKMVRRTPKGIKFAAEVLSFFMSSLESTKCVFITNNKITSIKVNNLLIFSIIYELFNEREKKIRINSILYQL